MSRFLLKVLVFGILVLGTIFLKNMMIPYYTGDKLIRSKFLVYETDKNNYNSVIFGSSRLYRQADPVILDSLLSEFGLNTFNFASVATFNPESYYLYDNFIEELDDGEIKLALLELQHLYPQGEENITSTKASYWNSIKYLRYSIDYINGANYPDSEKKRLKKRYFQGFYKRLIDFSILENQLAPIDYRQVGIDGFYSLDQALKEHSTSDILKKRFNQFREDPSSLNKRIAAGKMHFDKGEEAETNRAHLEYVMRLISDSEEKGIHLIFVLPPRLEEEIYRELIPLANSVPSKNIIQLQNYYEYPEFYSLECSFDVGHLNQRGSKIFSEELAKEIQKRLN